MLRLFNTLGKRMQTFHPADGKVVAMFTCGPSVYQRAHIGNFRTFLFEDILARYLEYSGYKIKRGMNLTDIEDKSIAEAERKKKTLKSLTEKNIRDFLGEMEFLKMKRPDYLPRASDYIDEEDSTRLSRAEKYASQDRIIRNSNEFLEDFLLYLRKDSDSIFFKSEEILVKEWPKQNTISDYVYYEFQNICTFFNKSDLH